MAHRNRCFQNLLLLVVYMVASQFANCEQLSESIPAAYKVVTSSMYIYTYIYIQQLIYIENIYNSIHAYSYISTYYIRCSYNISICIYIYHHNSWSYVDSNISQAAAHIKTAPKFRKFISIPFFITLENNPWNHHEIATEIP